MANDVTLAERVRKHWIGTSVLGAFGLLGAALTHRQDIVSLLEDKGIIPAYYGLFTDGELIGRASISPDQRKTFRLGGGYYGDVRPISFAGYRCTWKATSDGREITVEDGSCTISSDDVLEKVPNAKSITLALDGKYPSGGRISNPGAQSSWEIRLSVHQPQATTSTAVASLNAPASMLIPNDQQRNLSKPTFTSQPANRSTNSTTERRPRASEAQVQSIDIRCEAADERSDSADICFQIANYRVSLQQIALRQDASGILVRVRSRRPDSGFGEGRPSVILGTFDVKWLGSPRPPDTLELSSGSNGTPWSLAENFVNGLRKEAFHAE